MNYVIGKSDFRKDWFFEQVPHNEDPGNTTGNGQGRSTTWTITFNLPDAPHGKATLRLAICGIGTRSIAATMNDQSIGNVTGLIYNATINRDGIGGYWGEHDLVFDASLMKAGRKCCETDDSRRQPDQRNHLRLSAAGTGRKLAAAKIIFTRRQTGDCAGRILPARQKIAACENPATASA